MKQKLLLMLLFVVAMGHAQDSLSTEEQQRREKNIQAGNPFKKFGYKPKIATLSKGKYLEFHDLDSIVKIGSFSFHVKKKQITGYSVQETKTSEATLKPEIISRWFSPDPLSDEFPSWSPYHFVHNNPINLIDPDGRAALWVPNLNEDGSTTYTAEAGDSASTLASQYGISQDNAEAITGTTGTTEIAEGTEVSGQTVNNVTGSAVLKLDLNSKEGKSSQRRFDQFVYARDHSSSQGGFAFLSTDYYSNTQYKDMITGGANLETESGNINVYYKIPLYRITFDGSSTAVGLGNTPISSEQTTGRRFPGNQENIRLPRYHPNGARNREYELLIDTKNSNKIWKRLQKTFPQFNYINTQQTNNKN